MNGPALWIAERILDGQPHIGRAKLGNDSPVLIFHEGMNNALGMDDGHNLIIGSLKEPMGFDDLKPLIGKGR